jgi:hypothetical protein
LTGRLTRFAAAIVATLLATMTALISGPPASATPLAIGDCTTTSGAIVAVDFGHWGGPILRSCGSTPTTGYTLINQGGWHTAGTEHDGPAFICRIGYSGYDGGTQYPTPAQESCVLTPPASAYWAYWYANPGQNTWTYSQTGAMSLQPVPGSVELWTFGGTNIGGSAGSALPTVSPGSLRARSTTSTVTVKKPAPAHPTAAASGDGTKPATAAAKPTATPTRRPAPTPAHTATIRDAPPTTASAPGGHGSAVPAIVALAIVLALAAIGIAAALRRPRREQ